MGMKLNNAKNNMHYNNVRYKSFERMHNDNIEEYKTIFMQHRRWKADTKNEQNKRRITAINQIQWLRIKWNINKMYTN